MSEEPTRPAGSVLRQRKLLMEWKCVENNVYLV